MFLNRLLTSFILFFSLISVFSQNEKPYVIEKEEEEFDIEEFRKIFSGLENSRIIETGFLSDKTIQLVNFEDYSGGKDSKLVTNSSWDKIYNQIQSAKIGAKSKEDFFKDSYLRFSQNNNLGINFKNHNKENVYEELQQKINEEKIIPISVIDLNYNSISKTAFKKGLLNESNGVVYENSYRLRATDEKPYTVKSVYVAKSSKKDLYYGNNVNFVFDNSFYYTNKDNSSCYYEVNFDDGYGFRKVVLGDKLNISYSSTGKKQITLRKVNFDNGDEKTTKFQVNVRALNTPNPTRTLNLSTYIPRNYPHGGVTVTGKAYVYGNYPIKNPIIVCEGFDPENKRNWSALYEKMNKQNYLEYLKSNGYDIVVLNFGDGGTYIERNAYLLKNLIEKVNAIKTTDNKLTVIGASMGGLVSRYALAYMEKNNINHDTKLYISFDAPHRGANVPLGAQYWLKFFSYLSETAKHKYNKILGSIAAQQMLVYHTLDNSKYYRQKFSKNLKNIGYPSKLRKVAIANGSGNGIGQPFSPRENIINYRHRNPHIDIDGNAWAVPNWSKSLLFYGRLKFSWLAQSIKPYRNKKLKMTIKETKPYDNAPGGYSDTMKQIASTDTEGNGVIVANVNNHCFIPTISALDLRTDLFFNLETTATLYHFDKLYYPINKNESHIHISKDFVKWTTNELVPINLVVDNDRENRKSWNKGELRAQKSVVLKPGFHIKRGTTMRAYISPLNKGILNSYKPSRSIIATNNYRNFSTSENSIYKKRSSKEAFELAVYPNPVKNSFKIECKEDVISWKLLNLASRVLLTGNNKQVDISMLTKGVYILNVYLKNDKKKLAKKIIKL